MKKHSKWGICLIAALLIAASCILVACNITPPSEENKPTPPPAPLTISQATATIDLRETVQLSVEETGTIEWSSSQTAVCTVDANGLVKAVGAGMSTVTAAQGERKATCVVTVTNSRNAPQLSVSANGSATTKLIPALDSQTPLSIGVTYRGETVAASEVSNVTYSIDGAPGITVTPSDDGKTAVLNAGAYGLATLTVTATVWGEEDVVATVAVSVVNSSVVFTVTDESYSKNVDGQFPVSIEAIDGTGNYTTLSLPLSCVDGQTPVTDTITWSSSDEEVATVSGGTVTAKDLGSTVVTAAYNGNFAQFVVTVTKRTQKITLTDKAVATLFDNEDLLYKFPTESEIAAMRAKTAEIDIPDKVKGEVQSVTVKQILNNAEIDNDIFVSSEGNKVTVLPSYYGYNMGEKTATVETSLATYTLPLGIYTMIIDSPEAIDAFRYYTTYQHDWVNGVSKLRDGYFVLGNDVTYNESLTTVANTTSSTRQYTSYLTNVDRKAGVVGFCGVFDGAGHSIKGLYINDKSDKVYGGFIGVLVGYREWAVRDLTIEKSVYGTIKNIAFTNAIHGNTYVKSTDSFIGTGYGLLYSIFHYGKLENVYVEVTHTNSVKNILGYTGSADTLLSTKDGFESNIKNVIVEIKGGWADNDVLSGFGDCWAEGSLETLMPNCYTIVPTEKASAYKNIVPKGNSNTLASYTNTAAVDTANRSAIPTTGWDATYWDTTQGYPVFKTKNS